jgi:thiol:disulfide interchange protein
LALHALEDCVTEEKKNMRLTIALVMLATLSWGSNQVIGQEYGYSFSDQNYYTNDAVVQQPKAAKSYREAYQDAQAGDKPLLVLVTATWCPPCQIMKQTTIPELMRKESFKDFHYATVDLDEEKELGRQLIGSRGLPQLIMFEQENGKWIRRYLRGIQTVETVEAFVAQASIFRTADAHFSDTIIDK